MKAPSCLRNAIDGLFDDADQGSAGRVVSWGTWRRQAIYYLSFDEIALKIGCDVVNAANVAPLAGSVGEKAARRMMGQCFGEGLIVVDSGLESAALHAQASLSCTVTFEFEDPYELV